jgi:hypothetical protein
MLTPAEFAGLHTQADHLLPFDFFRPGSGGTRVLRFPYSAAVVGALLDRQTRQRLLGMPAWESFYRPTHPSDGLAVTAAILRGFYREALQRGQQPVVVLIPTLWDLQQLQQEGRLPYASLVALLDSVGMPTPRVADRMLRELDQRDPCDLYRGCVLHRHLNAEGNRLLAVIVKEWMEAEGLLPSGASRLN